jgi:hypothetical protein
MTQIQLQAQKNQKPPHILGVSASLYSNTALLGQAPCGGTSFYTPFEAFFHLFKQNQLKEKVLSWVF